MYPRSELDRQLRTGKLDCRDAIPAWTSETGPHVERRWGRAFHRFATTIVIGGGPALPRDVLTLRSSGNSLIPDDPIMSVARGLYKLERMQESCRSKRARRRQMAMRVGKSKRKGGRPRRETVVVRVKLWLRAGEDDDLIHLFASLPKRSGPAQ